MLFKATIKPPVLRAVTHIQWFLLAQVFCGLPIFPYKMQEDILRCFMGMPCHMQTHISKSDKRGLRECKSLALLFLWWMRCTERLIHYLGQTSSNDWHLAPMFCPWMVYEMKAHQQSHSRTSCKTYDKWLVFCPCYYWLNAHLQKAMFSVILSQLTFEGFCDIVCYICEEPVGWEVTQTTHMHAQTPIHACSHAHMQTPVKNKCVGSNSFGILTQQFDPFSNYRVWNYS